MKTTTLPEHPDAKSPAGADTRFAKDAIRTGLEMLMEEAGATQDELDAFIIAGAFGAYLEVTSCARIGMFPTLPIERYKQVGDAAGTGARQLTPSARRREAAVSLSRQMTPPCNCVTL
jgi:uncharacterized 2Fe-2S/4Fe-4S cluster protein (DUF4445 family)